MATDTPISPWRVLLPIGVGTSLSLFGDATLYTVLPTHTVAAGVSLASVGVLLSANRFIRLFLNSPAGLLYDRWRRRPLFVLSLYIGALSTAIYALSQGFWPLLAGRLLWGVAWAGIWVGGNTMALDVSRASNRGRWVGAYNISFFLGTASGTFAGGALTDLVGFHLALGIGAGLTTLGATVALIFAPETRRLRPKLERPVQFEPSTAVVVKRPRRVEIVSATGLLLVNRLALAGILYSTFSLFLLQEMGEEIQFAGRTLGVATVTGIGLGLNSLISMASAPFFGSLSDRLGNRWQAATTGLVPGVAGFGMLALGSPLTALLGLPLTAVTSGSNQGLATTLIGDLSTEGRRSRQLGWLFTMGDLASAIGPPLAYNLLIPKMGLKGVYLTSGACFALMLVVALAWAIRTRSRPLHPSGLS